MAVDEGLHREWSELLTEPIQEEIVVLKRDGVAYICDGWHRVAASVAKGEDIKAIVGRPHPEPESVAAPRHKSGARP